MAYRGIGYEAARAATSAMGAPQQKNALRNIVGAQLVGMAANELLKAPPKKEEEKDFGDRTRDFLRGAVNTVVPVYQMSQLYGGTFTPEAQQAPQAAQQAQRRPTGAQRVTTGRGEAAAEAPTVEYAQIQDLGQQSPYSQPQQPGAQGRAPTMLGGYAPFGLLKGSTPDTPTQTTERLKQQEEIVRTARAERPSGVVVTDLARKIAEDEQRKLRGLEEEARQYPGAQQQAPRVSATQNPLLQDVFRGTTTREIFSTGKAAGMPVEEPPMTRQEMAQERREDRAQRLRQAQTAQLGEELAQIPADPTTGERPITSPELKGFLGQYMEEQQYTPPRNTGELLSDQLEGQTAFQQHEANLPNVVDQNLEAIDASDEQGPGATSGSIGEMFKQQAQALAQSDARLYRSVGERLGKMKQLLSEVQGEEAIPTQSGKQLSAAEPSQAALPKAEKSQRALEQKNAYLSDMMSRLSSVQEDTQRQLREMSPASTQVPTSESVPEYVKSEFRAPEPSQPAPEPQTTRKVTIIEESPAPATQQQPMAPMEVAERLRRIQTSGRPTARQEAQDFLAQIRSQMSNG